AMRYETRQIPTAAEFSKAVVVAAALLAAMLFSALASAAPTLDELAAPEGARELRLLSAASMQTVFKEVVGDFEQRSGYKVSLRYSTMGAITERVIGGEEADLIISSPASISALAARGKVKPDSTVTVARTGVGIVIPAGDPTPRIASIDDFKQA